MAHVKDLCPIPAFRSFRLANNAQTPHTLLLPLDQSWIEGQSILLLLQSDYLFRTSAQG